MNQRGVVRNMATKRQLEEENATLRQSLEEIYDLVSDALDLDEESGESDAGESDDEVA